MAIVLFSSLVDGVRGKVGGNVFSAALGGPYAKNWSRSTNPRVERARVVRATLGGLGAAWQGLTSTQRSDWDTFAAGDPEPTYNSLGEPVTLSGWNYFCRCNQRRAQLGLDVLAAAPTSAEAVQPIAVSGGSLDVNMIPIAHYTLTWTAPGTGSTDYLINAVMVYPSGAPVYDPNVQRFIVGVSIELGTYNAIAEFRERFGNVRVGWTVAGFVWRQNVSGLRSTPEKVIDLA